MIIQAYHGFPLRQQWLTAAPHLQFGIHHHQTLSQEIPEINALASSVSLPPSSLYVTGTIFSRTSQMLVDTGASVTAVSSSFFSSLPSSPQLQPSSLLTIHTVSGEELPVQGQTTLTITLDNTNYPLEALVIDNLTYPVVLGRDFLMHYGSVIDMQANTLVLFGNRPIPLHHSPGVQHTTLRCLNQPLSMLRQRLY